MGQVGAGGRGVGLGRRSLQAHGSGRVLRIGDSQGQERRGGGPTRGPARQGRTLAALRGRVAFEPAHLFNLSFYHLLPGGLRWGASLHARSESDWTIVDAGIFGDLHHLHNQANWMLSAFGAWRLQFGAGFVEMGIRAYNIPDTAFFDMGFGYSRTHVETGGFRLGRRIFFYLKGAM